MRTGSRIRCVSSGRIAMRKALAALVLLGLVLFFGGWQEMSAAPAAAPAASGEDGEGTSYAGPVVPVPLAIVLILPSAKFGAETFERTGQPAVLGELLMGMVLGNLALTGFDAFEFLGSLQGIEILAQLG